MMYSQRQTSTKVSCIIAYTLSVPRNWRAWEFTGPQNVRLANLVMANYLEVGVLSVKLGRQMSRRQTSILLWSIFLALNSQNLRNPCFLKVWIFALDLKAMTKESLLKTPRPSQGVWGSSLILLTVVTLTLRKNSLTSSQRVTGNPLNKVVILRRLWIV